MKYPLTMSALLLSCSFNSYALLDFDSIQSQIKKNSTLGVTGSDSNGNPKNTTSDVGQQLEIAQQTWQSISVGNQKSKITWSGTTSMVYVNGHLFRAATQRINVGCTMSMTANSVTGTSSCKLTSLMALK